MENKFPGEVPGRFLGVWLILVSVYIIRCRYFFRFIARTINDLRDISFHAQLRGKMPMYLGGVIRQANPRN